MKFSENMVLDISANIEKKEGRKDDLSYLNWAIAYGLADLPEFSIPTFDGAPYRGMLGGAVVAVDLSGQRLWLPVLGNASAPIPLDKIAVRDVTDAHQRCLVKALAITHGVGLSLYAGLDGDGSPLAKMLPIDETTDLRKIDAFTEKKSQVKFVPWWAAVAACKLADPGGFHWEVVEFPLQAKPAAGEDSVPTVPYLKSKFGVMVAVDITFRGRKHRQWLPVMDFKFNSKADCTVMEWNTAVMRALTKGIAFVSGYGLSVYAGEPAAPAPSDTADSSVKAVPPKADELAGVPTAQRRTVKAILGRLDAGVSVAEVRAYLASAQSNKLGEAARRAIEDKIADEEAKATAASSIPV